MAAADDTERILTDLERVLIEDFKRLSKRYFLGAYNYDAPLDQEAKLCGIALVGRNIKSVMDSWIEATLSQEEKNDFKKYALMVSTNAP